MQKLLFLAAMLGIGAVRLFGVCSIIVGTPPPGPVGPYPSGTLVSSGGMFTNNVFLGSPATYSVISMVNVIGTPVLTPIINNTMYQIEWVVGGAGTFSSVTVQAVSMNTGCTATRIHAVSTISLPVELTAFRGHFDEKKGAAKLIWQTASEVDCAFFEVERSLDGLDFEAIGRVSGSGTTAETSDYFFEDETAAQLPSSAAFYRLRQVDLDEKSRVVGTVVRVDFGRAEKFALLEMRARAGGGGSVHFFSPDERAVVFEVFGLGGNLIFRLEAEAERGPNELFFDQKDAPSGPFFARLTGAGVSASGAFCFFE